MSVVGHLWSVCKFKNGNWYLYDRKCTSCLKHMLFTDPAPDTREPAMHTSLIKVGALHSSHQSVGSTWRVKSFFYGPWLFGHAPVESFKLRNSSVHFEPCFYVKAATQSTVKSSNERSRTTLQISLSNIALAKQREESPDSKNIWMFVAYHTK